MSLWVDKHRPSSLSKLDYHKDAANHLKKLVNSGDFPHMLMYGPNGAGKKTRMLCLLREIYGSGLYTTARNSRPLRIVRAVNLECIRIYHDIYNELLPSGVDRLRIEHHTFETPSKRKIDINTVASNYHIMVNPSDAGIYDRIVIQVGFLLFFLILSAIQKWPIV